MNKLYGDKLDKTKMKNRMRTLKKTYATMKRMIQHSGFGWNEETRKVDAEDDVWEQTFAAHPKDAQYRTKKLPDYSTLALIFGDTVPMVGMGVKLMISRIFKMSFPMMI
ncbi:uncharacterized protein At2g29880-like [Lycium ferocissimum]|uniref:uncharacterized protein At2g29880-like n=1 Tax=Lycium ferocissimum TaxID=112874 RepID=UPI002815EE89|nr:uncharacterized protein At2g29880-like [Lycium ferocissimum]